MDEIITNRLCLRKMTIDDAEAACHIYNNNQVSAHFTIQSLETPEQKKAFTQHIIANSCFIWTLRLLSRPQLVIGDCALHHLNAEMDTIEVGGSLLPAYWGNGFMAEAFLTVIQFAAAKMNIKYIVGKTHPHNKQAIRCMQKLGFEITAITEGEVQLTMPVLMQHSFLLQ